MHSRAIHWHIEPLLNRLAEFQLGALLPLIIALAATATAALARWTAELLLGGAGLPLFVFFFPAVMFVAVLSGMRAGLWTTGFSALAIVWLSTEPRGTLQVALPTQILGLALFVASSVTLCALCGAFRTAHAHSLSQSRRLDQEKSLSEVREKRYRQLFERNLAGAYLTRMDGTIIDVNDAMVNMLGLSSRAEALGHSSLEFYADPKFRQELIEQLQKDHYVPGREGVLRRKDGTLVYALGSAVLLRDETGEPYIQGVAIDLTARKHAEDRLRAEKAFSDLLINGVPGLFYLLDNEWRLQRWNAELEKLTGLTHDQLAQKPVIELVAPSDRAAAMEMVRACIAAGRAKAEIGLQLQGRTIPFLFTKQLLRIDGRTVIVSTALDISEQKRATEELRRSEAILKGILDAATESIWLFDRDGTVLLGNPVALHRFGGPAEQVIGHNITTFARSPVVEDRLRKIRQVADTGEPLQFEDERDGIIFRHHFFPVRNPDGRTTVASFSIDITARKHAEQVLARSKQELERLVQERTVKLRETVAELEYFSYSLTHDMRAPLRAMQGFSRILIEECGGCLSPERKEYLERIAKAANRMDDLITDALDYNRAVRQELVLEPIRPGALLAEMLESYPEFQSPKADIRLKGEFPEVLGNRAALTQCFSNLLHNALKFVAPGVTPRVRVWAEPRDGKVRLNFKDNGIGIAPQYHERIFHLFEQLDPGFEGTGVGLALVKKVVERMEGRIGIESAPGGGSTFWVELKRADGK